MLPEARLIPELIETAEARSRAMVEARPTESRKRTPAAPAIVRPHVQPVRRVSEAEMRAAIEAAVRHAIDVVGIEGLKRTSMFPVSSRRLAAEDERRRMEADVHAGAPGMDRTDPAMSCKP